MRWDQIAMLVVAVGLVLYQVGKSYLPAISLPNLGGKSKLNTAQLVAEWDTFATHLEDAGRKAAAADVRAAFPKLAGDK